MALRSDGGVRIGEERSKPQSQHRTTRRTKAMPDRAEKRTSYRSRAQMDGLSFRSPKTQIGKNSFPRKTGPHMKP